MSDPFGQPPSEEMSSFKVPEASGEDTISAVNKAGEYADPKNPGKLPGQFGKCIAWEEKEGPSGPMAVGTFVVTEGRFAGKEMLVYLSSSPKARFKVVETFKALGLPLDRPFPKKQPIGICCVLDLQDEEYQDQWAVKVKKVKAHPKGVGYRGAAALS